MLGLTDPWLAFCLDETLFFRLAEARATIDGEDGATRGIPGQPPDARVLSLLPSLDG